MQMVANQHPPSPPSGWVQRWSHLVPQGGKVLDVGCGQGRHVRWFAARGHPVIGIDRDAASLNFLRDLVATQKYGVAGTVQTVLADIENSAWPLMDGPQPEQFSAVVVTNYLWRPLMPTLLASLASGGVLIYETFSAGNASVGKPSRAEFLLQTGELLQLCASLRVIAFEEGFTENPPRFVQRIAAARPESAQPMPGAPFRYPL